MKQGPTRFGNRGKEAVFLMKNRFILNLILGTLLTGFSSDMVAESHDPLPTSGIPAGRAESILPANAIAHARLRSPQSLLEQAEALAIQTIPHKAVPAPFRPLLNNEHPLLTLLGMPTVQGELTSEAIAEHFGLDSDAAVTATLYPGDPTRFFIASVGIADPDTLHRTLTMFLGSEAVMQTSVGGRHMLRIRTPQLPLKALYVAFSDDRAYLSGEPSLLIHLYESGKLPSIADDSHLGNVLELVKNKDLVLSINPGLIKPFTSQLPFFKYVPLGFLAQARLQVLQGIPAPQRREIERQLQQQLGMSDLEEVLDYAECFVSATYEQLFDTLYQTIDGMNGTTFALRFHHAFPEMSFYLHHDQIQTSHSTRPIPLAAINEALEQLGTDGNHLTVSGQDQPSLASEWVTEWLANVRSLVDAKGLDTAVLDKIQDLFLDTIQPNTIESKVPWTVRMTAQVNPAKPVSEFQTLTDLMASRQQNLFARQSRPVTIIPQYDTAFLRQHFQGEIEAQEKNRELAQQVFRQSNRAQWILNERRLAETSLADRVQQFTLENAYVSQSGFFGYNQHEFINRKIFLAKVVGDYLVFHQAAGEPGWIQDLEPSHRSAEPYALQHLLKRLPRDVNYFTAHRGIGHLVELVDWLEDAEGLLHRDITHYLSEVREVTSGISDRQALEQAVQSLTFSPLVTALNQDAEGQFYCLLPGNITFPRAPLTPVLTGLFDSFRDAVDNKGGLIAYTRTLEGTKEWTVSWNTEGVSALVQNVGNALIERFMEDPQGIPSVMNLVINPRDRDPNRMEQTIAKNPAWRFLDQIQLPNQRRAPAVAKTEAKPMGPILERSDEAAAQHIDLGSVFNASMDETWQQGGIDGNTLSSLPKGLATIGGITYDLRGVVQLSGTIASDLLSVTFPKQVTEIPIGQQADQLHFLHACGWSDPEGTRVATYVVRYEDGETREIPIEYGIHLRDWWTSGDEAEVPNGDVAWIGSNPASASQNRTIQIYHLAWNNPRPDAAIQSLDFRSEMAGAAPFLLAITVDRD